MFGGYTTYRPSISDDEELHELILDLDERPKEQTSLSSLIQEVAIKANRLGKEKRKILRTEHEASKTNGIVTIWFICEHNNYW